MFEALDAALDAQLRGGAAEAGDASLFERLAACHLLNSAFPFQHMTSWEVNAALAV
jgi:hypothetical protein